MLASPAPFSGLYARMVALTCALLAILSPATAFAESHGTAHHALPPIWSTAFFVIMLLSIAILPLTPLCHWWEHNSNKLIVGLALSAYPLALLLVIQPNPHLLQETVFEYISFIVLLGTLFYVSGGILLTGDLKATPTTNFAFLAIGTLSASLIGTTGASMLLIRPVLRTNQERKNKVHIVIFFIFLVSNVGGSLLPIGDPPLFLGYLHGVPFFWTLSLAPQFAVVAGLLLAIFYAMDSYYYARETVAAKLDDSIHVVPLQIFGSINLLWLLGILLCVTSIRSEHGLFVREAAMIGCAIGSKLTTPEGTRERNAFSWGPILEVAALFIGIFLTMIPALEILRAEGGNLGVNSPLRFFWITGALSSVLDNAPTYLVFFETAQGMTEQGLLEATNLVSDQVKIPATILQAISAGAVFMGANTYIGNGPNFMVKAIADSHGVEMPSFFGYIRWSVTLLIPSFILVTLLFFR